MKVKGNISNIKSSVIFKKIFSFLSDNTKFDLVNFNKKIQKILTINLDDYKNKSHKYKLAKINGKGKEYIIDSNIVIFEGEYSNRKRNGKGKEYYPNGNIKFIGEYKSGVKIAGTEYDIEGNISFFY